MTRRLIGGLLLGLVLAGCARGAQTDQQLCERAAADDPVVKGYIIKGVGNPHAALEDYDKLQAAKQDATVACLRSRGVIRRGGVERQKPL